MEPAAASRRAETSVMSGSSDSVNFCGIKVDWFVVKVFPLSGGCVKFDRFVSISACKFDRITDVDVDVFETWVSLFPIVWANLGVV
jgi:hypothetical protein